MKNKIMVGIILCIILVGTNVPMAVATNIAEDSIKENPIDPNNITPCFLVGIMHERKVKIPWGISPSGVRYVQ